MTMRQDRFRELEVYLAVVAEGGLSAGARRLGALPSSVSRTIQRLETRLGVALIVRGPRLFRLTAEGEALFERSRRLLAQLDALERDIADRGQPRGDL
ncbi:MAG: LysR family transcriptional regulator, partial [Methylobacteriaceae bacterium]|nr:LysR family transcriptional regulator [Methylobacteriaceae bacterium]